MRYKRVFSIALSIVVLIAALYMQVNIRVSAAVTSVAYINGTSVNVRSAPSTGSTVIEKISYREVTVLEKTGDWLRVSYKSNSQTINGYIYYDSSYIYLTDYDINAPFETQLQKFPSSYHSDLQALHNKYPNWRFIPDYVDISLNYAVQLQCINSNWKQVSQSQPVSWRSMAAGSYDWNKNEWIFSNGAWTGASKEIIAYYMDPRNFLNEDEIYMFLKQDYDSGSYSEKGLKKVVAGTFLENGYNDPGNKDGYSGSYIKIILEAGRQAGVNPYLIASKIIQEQGSLGTSPLISGTYAGYEGYYNFFNYGASGNTQTDVIVNGLKTAKNNNWNSRPKSIIEGAKRYVKNYIEIGQDTFYYQDYNVHYSKRLENKDPHQYAQAVHDARAKGYSLRNIYKDDQNHTLTFRIPVYKNMPSTVCPKPVENNTLNNYYFTNITGVTPTFSMYTYHYDLNVTGDTTIKYTVPTGASLASPTEYSLNAGMQDIVLKVKSQSGYTNDYTISVKATVPCKLYITIDDNSPGGNNPGTPTTPSYKLGDVNNDGKITVSDLATIRLHLLGKYTISGSMVLAADINKDDKITVSDLATVRLHLLGEYTIK